MDRWIINVDNIYLILTLATKMNQMTNNPPEYSNPNPKVPLRETNFSSSRNLCGHIQIFLCKLCY